jgi:hypothetical protein
LSVGPLRRGPDVSRPPACVERPAGARDRPPDREQLQFRSSHEGVTARRDSVSGQGVTWDAEPGGSGRERHARPPRSLSLEHQTQTIPADHTMACTLHCLHTIEDNTIPWMCRHGYINNSKAERKTYDRRIARREEKVHRRFFRPDRNDDHGSCHPHTMAAGSAPRHHGHRDEGDGDPPTEGSAHGRPGRLPGPVRPVEPRRSTEAPCPPVPMT